MSVPIVLVVDSDEILTESLAYQLDSLGYEVYIVNNGLEAFAYVEQKNPSVVVMDILLKKFDGYRLLNLIQKSPFNPNVFVWTNLGNSEDKKNAKAYNIQGYYTKSSVSVEKLAKKLKKYF